VLGVGSLYWFASSLCERGKYRTQGSNDEPGFVFLHDDAPSLTTWQGLMCIIERNSISAERRPHNSSVPHFVALMILFFHL